MAQDREGGRPFEVQGYREVSQIGRGASSTVYRGYDPELSRWVAIKVLLTDDPDDPARKRFKREGEITANLGKHPHIVQVLSTGFTASGSPYVVMELFEQGSIADRLRTSGAFTVDETLDIGEKIADAVSAAHRAGVLHRDIKPQNILLSEYGPALGDFGIARTSANLEWSQSLDQLTPMHAAPEILLGGTSTVQSDLYALGSTLYTMLSGRPPFAGSPGEAPLRYQVRVVQDPVPPIPRADLPAPVIEVIECALAKSPADRYGSASELREALRSCQHQRPAVTAPVVTPHAPIAPLSLPHLPAVASSPLDGPPPVVAHLAPPPVDTAPSPDAPDETVTRSGAGAPAAQTIPDPGGMGTPGPTASADPTAHADPTVGPTAPGDPSTAPTIFPGLPYLPAPPSEGDPAGAGSGPVASPGPAPDEPEHTQVPVGVAPPSDGTWTSALAGAPADDGDGLTIQRPISTLDPTPSDQPADGGNIRRRRTLILAGVAGVVLVIAGAGALVLLHKPAPAKIRVKKEYTITTTDADKPTTLRLVSTGSGATLQWTASTGERTEFLVYEISSSGSKIVGVTPAGKTAFSLPAIDPSSTQDCFEVRARIDASTVGAPAQWCPTGESVSGS